MLEFDLGQALMPLPPEMESLRKSAQQELYYNFGCKLEEIEAERKKKNPLHRVDRFLAEQSAKALLKDQDIDAAFELHQGRGRLRRGQESFRQQFELGSEIEYVSLEMLKLLTNSFPYVVELARGEGCWLASLQEKYLDFSRDYQLKVEGTSRNDIEEEEFLPLVVNPVLGGEVSVREPRRPASLILTASSISMKAILATRPPLSKL